ncbi:MAG: ATP-binding protein [Planctomycetota bacterium]|nr:ATP-binding protein [Planctomycetota bacterium]
MASLFVIQGRDRGHRFELDRPLASLGRDVSNTFRLQDTEVSRRHIEIRRTDDQCELVDLGSSNGSFVNGEQVEHCLLNSGDQVQIGRTLMLFTGGGDASTAELDYKVDILPYGNVDDSRIVHALTEQEGSAQFFDVSDKAVDSPWLARARSNLQVMYRTALAVSHTLDIDELLGRIMELIFEWVEADRGCIMLVNNETDELEPKVRRNRGGATGGSKIEISKTILDYVTEHAEGVLTSNAKDDTRWDTGASILKMDIREAICVPMRGRYGIVGVIYIDSSTPPQKILQQGGNKFTEDHLKLMVAIGHQAALAVEDTSYYSAMVHAERLAAVGQTIAMLSHHIKNILQGIRGGSYLIELGLEEDDKEVMQKGWTIVEKNQARISNLVMDMLAFSKDREPEVIAADLNDVVADVIEIMQTRAEEMSVKLSWRPAGDLPKLMFDPEGMHRAVLNVVTNAIDACETIENASVEVSTSYLPAEDEVRVVVEDNGSGIEPEQLQNLFTLFVSTKGARGTGLGLHVSQKICREHGGRILVDSQPNSGSRFILEIPAVDPPVKKPDGDDSSMRATFIS